MYRVRTPVAGVTEVIAGVSFVDGTADCGDGPALAYFRSAGYAIADLDDAGPADEPDDGTDPPAVQRPRGNESEATWRAYALAVGFTDADLDGLGRAQIIALIDEEKH